MYTFKETISEQEFEAFAARYSCAPIQQTLAWPKLKSNWKSVLCGIYKDNTLCGAAMVLIRKLLPGFSVAYCPRGPLLDYSDMQAVKAFADGAKALCKKHGAYELSCDPLIPYGLTLPNIDEKNYYNPYDTQQGKQQFENLVNAGFRHGGFGKSLHDTLQPRFNAMIPLCNADGEPLTAQQLKKNLPSRMRTYFGAFSEARGLYYEKAELTEENFKLFESVLQKTEERQNISLRNSDYFKQLCDSFGAENAEIAFRRCNVSVYLRTLRERLAKEPENEEKLLAQIAEAEEIIAQEGEVITLAALLNVYPPNKEGIRIAEYLYGGTDLRRFAAFRAMPGLLYEQCLLCIERGCHYLNLGGFAGTFDDGLFNFKNHFNPLCIEYAGEFTLVIDPLKYTLMSKALPTLKKVYKKLFAR